MASLIWVATSKLSIRIMSAVSVIGEFCVVARSALTIGMLKEEVRLVWMNALGMPHLWVNVQGESGGALMESDI